MIAQKVQINMFNLITTIARIVDIMSMKIGNHHMQVAYLSYRIGEELGLPVEKKNDLLVTGILHDIGAFSLKDRIDLLEFEDINPGEHSLAGYLLLRDFKLFSNIADLVKFHHIPWKNGGGRTHSGESVSEGSHIIHLADRVSVLISGNTPILSQVEGICDSISRCKHKLFKPSHVDAMIKIAKQDYIWMEVTSTFIERILKKIFFHWTKELLFNELIDFSRLICRLIDFKSPFTATHSSGVAATAVSLGKHAGFSKNEQNFLEIAAFLHDLGKLAIPSEILEKQKQLTNSEWYIMRSHVYYTYQALEQFEMLNGVAAWGGFHQERLNGTGYPFGYKEEDLPLGARIMAVADVFTALTENRPYRKGMTKKDTMDVLYTMQGESQLDKRLTELLFSNYDTMNNIRMTSQNNASKEYHNFRESLKA